MSTDDPNRRPRKPRKPAPRKNTKVTGERSEAAFLHKAATLEFGVAKPWGDSRRYDFILDNGECLHRIQVKCTESIRMQAYETPKVLLREAEQHRSRGTLGLVSPQPPPASPNPPPPGRSRR